MSESKQDVVVRMVKAGQSTREEIKEAAGCTSGALASYLSAMANAAKFTGAEICPIEEEIDGKKVFTVMTYADVQAIKEERAANRSPGAVKKSPEERLKAAEKRLTRSESALDKLDDRISAADGEVGEELQLRFDKAKIEVQLAEIEIARLNDLVSSADEDDDVDEDEDEDEDLM